MPPLQGQCLQNFADAQCARLQRANKSQRICVGTCYFQISLIYTRKPRKNSRWQWASRKLSIVTGARTPIKARLRTVSKTSKKTDQMEVPPMFTRTLAGFMLSCVRNLVKFINIAVGSVKRVYHTITDHIAPVRYSAASSAITAPKDSDTVPKFRICMSARSSNERERAK